uniref:Uncharacterized protein n=1 Tax=Salix viminalis TaxID=40686 RepID=A0A6N2N7I6_SALVM
MGKRSVEIPADHMPVFSIPQELTILYWSWHNKSPNTINHVSRDPVSHWYCYELQEVPLHFK